MITASLRSMKDIDGETLKQERRQKFLQIGRNL
jgi:acetyl-CoA carboxylase carboxyl transferase subunit alpha